MDWTDNYELIQEYAACDNAYQMQLIQQQQDDEDNERFYWN